MSTPALHTFHTSSPHGIEESPDGSLMDGLHYITTLDYIPPESTSIPRWCWDRCDGLACKVPYLNPVETSGQSSVMRSRSETTLQAPWKNWLWLFKRRGKPSHREPVCDRVVKTITLCLLLLLLLHIYKQPITITITITENVEGAFFLLLLLLLKTLRKPITITITSQTITITLLLLLLSHYYYIYYYCWTKETQHKQVTK